MDIDKQKSFSDWYNEVIKQAALCDLRYNIKGFIVIMPWAMRSIDRIYSIYEKVLAETKHHPAFFPSLIHEKSLSSEKEHVKGFVPEVLWVTEAGDKKLEERYALKPTGEASIYPMYALWVNGLSDLPIKLYQRGWVWRHETKATKPFIRGREFLWIEAHDAFATKEEARTQVMEDISMTKLALWNSLGIPFIYFKRPQWDKFPGADDTFAADTLMPDGKLLQIASTHLLGQHFSKAFEVKYANAKNEMEYVWQTCYGPGVSRIYAASVAVHGDNRGLVFPYEIAPVQIVIIPILRKGSEEKVLSASKKLEKELSFARVELDLRDQTPGFKFNHWEQKGVPFRIEIGERDLESGSVVLATRDDGKKRNVKMSEIGKELVKEAKAMDARMKEKSSVFFKNALDSAKNLEEMNEKVLKGKIVKVPFCGDGKEAEKCWKTVKEQYSCDARGTMSSSFDSEKIELDAPAPKGEKCIGCGKAAKVSLYISRQY